jgi:hypothetical protein
VKQIIPMTLQTHKIFNMAVHIFWNTMYVCDYNEYVGKCSRRTIMLKSKGKMSGLTSTHRDGYYAQKEFSISSSAVSKNI